MIAARLRITALGGLLMLACGTGGITAAAPSQVVAEGKASLAVPVAAFITYEGELTQGGFIRGKVLASTKSLTLDGNPVPISPSHEFFVAFDRDASGTAKLVQTFQNGFKNTETLTIAPRDWQMSYVNVARGRGNDLEAYWAKREPEYNAIRDARAKRTGAQGWKQDFIWPVKARISGLFGRQRVYAGEPADYHGGIDIAAGGGTPFVAPADGVVVLARTGFSLEGGIIIVDHGAGLNSAFIHLSRLVVEEGQSVTQGQYLGDVGGTGRASGPHLHWSVMWNEARIDPLLLTGPM